MRRSRGKLVQRTAASILLAVVLLLAGRRIAWAHTELIASDPAADARLSAAPTRIRLLFSEPVEASLARITILGADGTISLPAPVGDPRDVDAIIVSLAGTDASALKDGAYRVRWHVVSVDGHAVDGSFVFTIGEETAVAPSDSAAVDHSEEPATSGSATVLVAGLRGLALGTLLLLAGLLVFQARAEVGAPEVALRMSGLSRSLAIAAPVLFSAQLLLWATRANASGSFDGASIVAALSSETARVELWRLGSVLLATWALVLMRRGNIALVFAAIAVVLSGAIGHAAAVVPLASIPAKALHLASAAVWLGGVVWLAAHLRVDPPIVLRVALRVSRFAFASALLVVASGGVQSLLLVPATWDALRSPYGLVLLAKLVGTAALIGFGAYHRRRSLPRLQEVADVSFLRTMLRREIVVMFAVLLLGGVLSSTELPPASSAPAPHVHPPS